MKIVKIARSSLSDEWSVYVSTGTMYFEVFKSKYYGQCVVIASAYIQVGYTMIDPNGHYPPE